MRELKSCVIRNECLDSVKHVHNSVNCDAIQFKSAISHNLFHFVKKKRFPASAEMESHREYSRFL